MYYSVTRSRCERHRKIKFGHNRKRYGLRCEMKSHAFYIDLILFLIVFKSHSTQRKANCSIAVHWHHPILWTCNRLDTYCIFILSQYCTIRKRTSANFLTIFIANEGKKNLQQHQFFTGAISCTLLTHRVGEKSRKPYAHANCSMRKSRKSVC